jgi:SAM-dependent methyltransferase
MSEAARQDDNVYFVDHESAAEMARLLTQDRMLTKGLEDLFPATFDTASARTILDLGCGPGGWVQEVAFAYPQIEVTGMDVSQSMIAYATMQAKVQGLENAHFTVGDLLEPLNLLRSGQRPPDSLFAERGMAAIDAGVSAHSQARWHDLFNGNGMDH